MTTPVDRGFEEVTDMYYEIAEAINSTIEALKSLQDARLYPGTRRRIYDIILETRIKMCNEIQEIVYDVYARHDYADYAGSDQ